MKGANMAAKLRQTPTIDELLKGPWPSFLKEIKKAAQNERSERGCARANDLLGVLELSYKQKIGHWKHGGIVGVMGYGGGVIGRYNDLPEEFPNVAHFHTLRINQPSGWFYTSEVLRKLCDIWDRHGSGITNMHGSTGDIVFLGCATADLEPVFAELTAEGFDLGGSGSAVRTPSGCCGMARCEWACYDTLALTHDLTKTFQDELHRPAFPYKFKFKMSGCPNDCVASIARADMSIIGTWRDDIQIDEKAVADYASKLNMEDDVISRCPTKCMSWDGKKLSIDNSNCVKCMHCINVMPKALAPGKDRGATILLGSKAPIIGGALLSSVMVPFLKIEPPYEDIKELAEAIWDLWAEHGKNRERVGEFIQRIGMGNFLEQIGLDPIPEMVIQPRSNPYIFFEDTD
jgi:sulfite reductase alpha subunit